MSDRPYIAADTETCETIERMMDKYGTVQVLSLVADILMEKSAHVQENWQDGLLSRSIGKAGKAVNLLAHNKIQNIAGDIF